MHLQPSFCLHCTAGAVPACLPAYLLQVPLGGQPHTHRHTTCKAHHHHGPCCRCRCRCTSSSCCLPLAPCPLRSCRPGRRSSRNVAAALQSSLMTGWAGHTPAPTGWGSTAFSAMHLCIPVACLLELVTVAFAAAPAPLGSQVSRLLWHAACRPQLRLQLCAVPASARAGTSPSARHRLLSPSSSKIFGAFFSSSFGNSLWGLEREWCQQARRPGTRRHVRHWVSH